MSKILCVQCGKHMLTRCPLKQHCSEKCLAEARANYEKLCAEHARSKHKASKP